MNDFKSSNIFFNFLIYYKDIFEDTTYTKEIFFKNWLNYVLGAQVKLFSSGDPSWLKTKVPLGYSYSYRSAYCIVK